MLFQKLKGGELSDKVCPGGLPLSKSHGSWSASFYVHFLFV